MKAKFMKMEFDVKPTIKNNKQMKPYVTSKWCECLDKGKEPEFLCYPEDNCCVCGVQKHHAHCANCGGVYQVG